MDDLKSENDYWLELKKTSVCYNFYSFACQSAIWIFFLQNYAKVFLIRKIMDGKIKSMLEVCYNCVCIKNEC